MKNVLVTGGAGFIGSNFIRFLQLREPDVNIVNLDALTYAGSLENIKTLPDPERHTFVQGDICEQELVERILRDHAVDTIVHFAAESHVDRSILGPAPFIQTNIIGTFTLLEAGRGVWEERGVLQPGHVRFHHVSTDEVYGSLEPEDPPFTETTSYAPNSPYAASKASSDHIVRAFATTYGLPVTVSNCSNNYGPHQFPEKLVPLIILNALQGQPLPIYGDGLQIRDWLYVDDHCEAIWKILKDGREGETYNIGGETESTNLDLVHKLCATIDQAVPNSKFAPHDALITFVEDRPGHDRRYAMDIDKIKRELGWQPKESLESGLSKTIDWYLSNQAWIQTIRERPSYEEWLMKNYNDRGAQA